MVIGIDDDKQQQLTTRMTVIPRNFKFIKCQFLKQALSSFSDASFDLISTRFLMMENTRQQYQDILKESLRLCKPNGYIEVMELDMRIYQQKLISITTTQLLNNKGEYSKHIINKHRWTTHYHKSDACFRERIVGS